MIRERLSYCCGCGRRLKPEATAMERQPDESWDADLNPPVFVLYCPVCAALGPQPAPLAVRLRVRFAKAFTWLEYALFSRLP